VGLEDDFVPPASSVEGEILDLNGRPCDPGEGQYVPGADR
jgi:hypothetical protein